MLRGELIVPGVAFAIIVGFVLGLLAAALR